MEDMKPDVPPTGAEASTESFPPSYRYRNAKFQIIWQTSVPKDDEAALAYFHVVTRFGPEYAPVYVERIDRTEDGEKATALQEAFDPVNCVTKPLGADIS